MPLASPAKTSFTMTLSSTKFHGCSSDTTICPTVRPLPYFGACPQVGERELAASLRRDFVPLLARRLPDHHLVGQRHGAAPAFVARHKKSFPCFVRTDIARSTPLCDIAISWRASSGMARPAGSELRAREVQAPLRGRPVAVVRVFAARTRHTAGQPFVVRRGAADAGSAVAGGEAPLRSAAYGIHGRCAGLPATWARPPRSMR